MSVLDLDRPRTAQAPDAAAAPLELTILMPCLNEAETIEVCVRKAKGYLERSGVSGEVLIADNGSTDGSQDMARALGARVVDVPEKGYGAALIGGIAAARSTFIVMGDADDSYDFEKLDDGQSRRTMQDDLDDGEDWAVKQGIADKNRVCIDGSSYGGYAALWGVERNPERYSCAASFAGVTNWEKMLKYDANFFTSSNSKKWSARVRGAETGFDMNSVSPAKQAAKLTRPVLIAQGKRDSTVPYSQFKEMRDALSKAKFTQADYLVFDKEGHGFDTAEDEQKWYDALDAFLKKTNPAD